VLQIVADRQVVDCGAETCPPLPDLGHEAFPHLTFVKICDYWLYAFVGCTIVRFSPIFVSKSLSLVMLRRWAFLQGSLFWMRGISVALTRQSVPQEDCITTATGNAWIEGFYIMTGVHITCGDIMYSGHTAGITLCTLIWTHYSKGEEFSICCGEHRPFITPNLDAVGDPASCSLTSVVVWALAFTGFFFIIATHFHYSNDVFIGCIITQFVFKLYHYYIKTVSSTLLEVTSNMQILNRASADFRTLSASPVCSCSSSPAGGRPVSVGSKVSTSPCRSSCPPRRSALCSAIRARKGLTHPSDQGTQRTHVRMRSTATSTKPFSRSPVWACPSSPKVPPKSSNWRASGKRNSAHKASWVRR
jgi:hypothetical protein